MDSAKLQHIELLGSQLLWLRQTALGASPVDVVSLKPSDLEPPPPTTARGGSLTPPSALDTGFVTQGSVGWGEHGVLTASARSDVPVMSVSVKPALAASSEPALRRASRLDRETDLSSLYQVSIVTVFFFSSE